MKCPEDGAVLVEMPTCPKCWGTWMRQRHAALSDASMKKLADPNYLPCLNPLPNEALCVLACGHEGECKP